MSDSGENHAPPTPEQLLERVARARDVAAFRQLFDLFAPRLKGFLRRQGMDVAEIEELIQEAFLTLWRRAETFDSRQASVATWLFTIARNKRIDWLRKANRPQLDPEDPGLRPVSPEMPDAAAERRDMARHLAAALQTLSPEEADVVRLSFLESKSHREIASDLGVPLGTVKSRIRRGLKRLHITLADTGDEPE